MSIDAIPTLSIEEVVKFMGERRTPRCKPMNIILHQSIDASNFPFRDLSLRCCLQYARVSEARLPFYDCDRQECPFYSGEYVFVREL